MDRLPQELVDNITSFLPKERLKNVLTLTRSFNYAVERQSGAFAKFTINESNIDKFILLYSGYRLAYLQKVTFRPRFPTIYYSQSSSRFLKHYTENEIQEKYFRTGEDQEDIATPCREDAGELRKRDQSFTRQIRLLFTALKSVEEATRDVHFRGRYKLAICSPVTLVEHEIVQHCLHHYNVSWRVHLLDLNQLPQLNQIRSLQVRNHSYMPKGWRLHSFERTWRAYSRHGYDLPLFCHDRFDAVESRLDPRVIIDLATKLPHLESLDLRTGVFECKLNHSGGDSELCKVYNYLENDWEGPRRDARHDFAASIVHGYAQLPNSLKRVYLDFLSPLRESTDLNHEEILPDLMGSCKRDPFSSSLRILSSNLSRLHLRAMVDESLFWPEDDMVWFGSNLEYFEIVFHIARPDGKWFFHGPNGEGRRDAFGFSITDKSYPPLKKTQLDKEMDDLHEEKTFGVGTWAHIENNKFRITPDETLLRGFLEGFAKAAAQMRLLKHAILWAPLSWEPGKHIDPGFDWQDRMNGHVWGIMYAAPITQSATPEDLCPSRQLWWKVDQWRPNYELHEAFKRIGYEDYRDEVKEHWEILDWQDRHLFAGPDVYLFIEYWHKNHSR